MNPKVKPLKNFIEIIYDKFRGIKFGEKSSIEFSLNKETSSDRIDFIISELDHRTVLRFYDAFYSLPPNQEPVPLGDTGAFAEVRKNKNNFEVKLGNHGGYKNGGNWIKISRNDLAERIYKSRHFNGGRIKLESRLIRRQWRKDEGGKVLMEFHHDITDKKPCANTV